MIRLKEDLEFNSYIRKICLPMETNKTPNKWFGQSINLVGYGAVRNVDETNPLRSAKLEIVEHDYCIGQHNIGKLLPNVGSQIRINFPGDPLIMANQMCAAVDGVGVDAGSCAGDSGSPALKKDYGRNAFYQVGILHGSVGTCSAAIFPSVFTRLDDPGIMEFVTGAISSGNSGK